MIATVEFFLPLLHSGLSSIRINDEVRDGVTLASGSAPPLNLERFRKLPWYSSICTSGHYLSALSFFSNGGVARARGLYE